MQFDPDDPRWTFMARTSDPHGRAVAVYEDFTRYTGSIAIVGDGEVRVRPKSAEPLFGDGTFLGHRPEDVWRSDHDLLGAQLLARGGDPSYAEVAAALPPITTMPVHSFVGTPSNPDRVGGWLPALRFVYELPDGHAELLLFAPPTDHPRIQPVWYRIARITGGRLARVSYVDSYRPSGASPDPSAFYRDFLIFQVYWEAALEGAMRIEIPDRRLADQARHGLVRARMTRVACSRPSRCARSSSTGPRTGTSCSGCRARTGFRAIPGWWTTGRWPGS